MRVQDKINEINHCLSEVESFTPKSFNDYKTDLKVKAACERYFEKITEATIDLAKLMLRHKGMEIPKENKDIFNILERKEIISKNLSFNLKQAKSMRNILIHQYGNINDKTVFESLTKELIRDVREFIKAIKKNISN